MKKDGYNLNFYYNFIERKLELIYNFIGIYNNLCFVLYLDYNTYDHVSEYKSNTIWISLEL